MNALTQAPDTLDEARLEQFEAMMEQFASIQAKYKGVRGELLAKVRAELMRLRPGANSPTPTPPAPVAVAVVAAPKPRPTPNPVTERALPSCRVCGRGMKVNASEGNLTCERGHTRALT